MERIKRIRKKTSYLRYRLRDYEVAAERMIKEVAG